MTAALMVDLSSNNALPNLRQHYKAGYRTLALKATEGDSYAWVDAQNLAVQWHKLGGAVWHYHFARPGDARLQAKRFLQAVRDRWADGDRIVLDAEVAGVDNGFVQTFIGFCHTAHPDWPGVVYSYSSFLTEAKIRPAHGWGLWLADYETTQPAPVQGWKSLTAWQFTDKATVPGFPSKVDQSRLVAPPAPAVPHPLTTAHRAAMLELVTAMHARHQPLPTNDRKVLTALAHALQHALSQ